MNPRRRDSTFAESSRRRDSSTPAWTDNGSKSPFNKKRNTIESSTINEDDTSVKKKTFLKAKKKQSKCEATVDCLDFSPALDLIAFGGLHGVGFLDSKTIRFKNLQQPHQTEVSGVHFYDSELMMLSLAKDGEIALWDA